MKSTRNPTFICLAILAGMLLVSCKGDDEESGTDCGVLHESQLENPVKEEDGDIATVTEVVDANQVVIRLDGNDQAVLVLLHGLNNQMNEARRAASISFLRTLPKEVTFFRARENCDVDSELGDLVPGQLITDDERSYSEELLKANLGQVEESNLCGSEQLQNCFVALQLEANNGNSALVEQINNEGIDGSNSGTISSVQSIDPEQSTSIHPID